MSRSGRGHPPTRGAAGGPGGSAPPKVALISLGCPKNLVDSEAMAEILESIGFKAAGEISGADLVLINTCSFVREATEESLETVAQALRLKREGAVGKVVLAGCLVQRMGERIAEEFPDLDGAVGTGSWPLVGEVCRLVLSGSKRQFELGPPGAGASIFARRKSSHGHFGYLKVTEGCHRRCSYCVIPGLRGPLRSARPDALLAEAEALARSGVVELILVGEDIGSYGKDTGGEWVLADLIRKLNVVPDVRWIRLMYVHPASVDAGLIQAAEECEKVCAYIDIPVQHASDRVLDRMKRPTSRADLERVLRALKESSKNFALRTTVMVGFPGETEAEFAELKSFVKEWEFDHLGAFCYSPEAGTEAAGLGAQVKDEVKEKRKSEIMRAQSEISQRKNKAAVGSVAVVLVDEREDGGVLRARTQRQAPQVDGLTLVYGSMNGPGDFLAVRVTDGGAYDLYAVPDAGSRT